MQSDPINTIPIQQFIQQVKAADNGNQREIRMPIAQAKNLAFTLGIISSRLTADLEKVLVNTSTQQNEIIEVRLDGGTGFND